MLKINIIIMNDWNLNSKIVEKLDNLLEQNKTLAKGIILLHEKGVPEHREIITPTPNPPKIPAARYPQQSKKREYPKTSIPKKMNV